MGLIKAAFGAVGGVLADQWREYFYCEALPTDMLVAKGQKRTSGRSSNTKGEENIISNGSIIAVADGQCMIIVEQGKVVDISAEPGEYTYDQSTEPSIFYGKLSQNIPAVLKNIGKRFTFGGEPPKDQRIYYFNTKELLGNAYRTPAPVPFRVVDNNIGLDIDVGVTCFGEFSYKIVNPVLFYANVTGNVGGNYPRSNIDSQLQTELLTALQPAFAKLSAMGIRYSALPGHTTELADALNEVLSQKWGELRGLEVASFGVSSITAGKDDEKMIRELQRNAALRNPTMAAATLVGAQSDAMRAAASNEGGAMMGFMGLGMAQQAGGMNAANLFQMGQQQQQQPPPQAASASPQGAPSGWTCPSCAHEKNTGKFCAECGTSRPAEEGWNCSCGAVNKGKFCPQCGGKKPAGVPQYTCDKCGWEPENKAEPPKFCPECGDPFDDGDVEK